MAPRQAAVADLEAIVPPIEAWSAAVTAERKELETLDATADDRTAALVDDLPRVRSTVAAARGRIDGVRAPSPSAHATLLPEADGLAGDLAVVEDQARVAAASLAAARRPPGVLALRAALRATASLAARAARIDETADRVARAVAERAQASDEASVALDRAAGDLATSPMPALTPRLDAARDGLAAAGRETDALVAWEAMRAAANEAGSIHAEVLAARRRAREALDGARIAAASMVLATHDRSDVRASTRRIADDIEERLRTLLADPPVGPDELRARAQAIADDAGTVRRRADRDVQEAREQRVGRHAIGAGAGVGFMSSASDIGGSSSGGTSSSIGGVVVRPIRVEWWRWDLLGRELVATQSRRSVTTSSRNDVSRMSTPAMTRATMNGSGCASSQPAAAANAATARKASRMPRMAEGRSRSPPSTRSSRRTASRRSASAPTTLTATSSARTSAGGATIASRRRASQPSAVPPTSASRPTAAHTNRPDRGRSWRAVSDVSGMTASSPGTVTRA